MKSKKFKHENLGVGVGRTAQSKNRQNTRQTKQKLSPINGIAVRPGRLPSRVNFHKECSCHQIGKLQLQKGWRKHGAERPVRCDFRHCRHTLELPPAKHDRAAHSFPMHPHIQPTVRNKSASQLGNLQQPCLLTLQIDR